MKKNKEEVAEKKLKPKNLLKDIKKKGFTSVRDIIAMRVRTECCFFSPQYFQTERHCTVVFLIYSLEIV